MIIKKIREYLAMKFPPETFIRLKISLSPFFMRRLLAMILRLLFRHGSLRRLHGDRKSALIIDKHALGGGSIIFSKRWARNKSLTKNVLILDHKIGNFYDLLHEDISIDGLDISKPLAFQRLLKRYPIDEIFINQLAGLNIHEVKAVIDSIINCGLPFDFMLHDYFCLCPSIKLVHGNVRYAGTDCQNNPGCQYSEIIPDWRHMFEKLLTRANNVVTLSMSAKDMLLAAFPRLDNIKIASHQHTKSLKPLFNESDLAKTKMTIGIMGAISREKGLDAIYRLAKKIKETGLSIDIKIIGYTEFPVPIDLQDIVEVKGKYSSDSLEKTVIEEHVSFFIFPSIWPETYSFVCDEIIRMGFPILCFDLGAQRERIDFGKYGWLIKTQDEQALFEKVVSLFKNRGYIAEKAENIRLEVT